MSKKRKPVINKKALSKKIIKYYFNNPHANNYKHMIKKLKVSESTIRKILSDELENRFKSPEKKLRWERNY